MKQHNPAKNKGKLKLQDTAMPLVPGFIFYYLIFVALALPNLIFSGAGWFDTLHIMKWAFAMIPIAFIAITAGGSLMLYGGERTSFKLELFGCIWLVMLAYISVQASWANIMSWSTYIKEWFFFATLLGTYIFCYNCFKDGGCHKALLWFANINAALNIVFAELLIRDMNGPFPFIMNVPGNYIGNTGQQEMFGLWMAMAAMNGIYLNAAYSAKTSQTTRDKVIKYANLLLLAFNAWGMWNSTTRAGVLALLTGTIIITFIFSSVNDRTKMKKVGQGVVIVLFVLSLNIATARFGWSRAYAFLNKTMDMFQNAATFGMRRGIWQTSWAIFMEHPIKGVGLGQYKWHYLEGQRLAFQKHPDMKWQFTYWAHSEYLQWFAEFGIFGMLLLLGTGGWWLWSFVSALINKKQLSLEASWACAMLFLIWFDAIFSRPFHRIENVLWLSLAFAIANRELFCFDRGLSYLKRSSVCRLFGAFIVIVAVTGLWFFSTGLRGDQYLHSAVRTNNAGLQAQRINAAKEMLMSRDEAEEQYAYHLIAVARATGKPQDWANAINQLYRSFTIRPQAKQLLELVNYAQQTKNQKLLELLIPYLHPGSIQTAPASAQSSPAS